ncbi:methylaspartate mutase (plasmid) [Streptomyces sp. NBC_01216]|uniref:cobalamin B12-binding domain-containing protein n=1 Tax=Streptomyces sp. NBC_01216 TaxID=2903778 RepID=UPI002E160E41|nr:cobalamin-dependent protein [Streptomyces sp. NBC_01216]WSQ69830.1 methylaspartate mutase [Streptomyces sp. NBC_01216]
MPCAASPTAVLSTVSSDSHTWNLIFLELLLTETGYHVHNLGACVPDELLIGTCHDRRPDLLVLSSVNGHGAIDGARVIRSLRAAPALAALPAVIGGKLGTDGDNGVPARRRRLTEAGFDAVFEGASAVVNFQTFARDVRDAALIPGGVR